LGLALLYLELLVRGQAQTTHQPQAQHQ